MQPIGSTQENRREEEAPLIAVDRKDTVIGYCTRDECHAGDGIRHRAFSIFIFDGKGRMLIQKRSREKALWPLYWSNSCCSHPRAGETSIEAAHRRLFEELGIRASLTFAFKFAYQAQFGSVGSENELCTVYVGHSDRPVNADPLEIDQWRYITVPSLEEQMAKNPNEFTPWFKLEWARLRKYPLVTAIA